MKRSQVVAAAFAAIAGTAAARAQAPALRLGTSLSDPFLEPFYAQDQGLFRGAGLDVDVQTLGNGSVILQAVVGGALDAGNTDLIQLANAFNRGVKIAVFASGAYYSVEHPTISLCVTKNSPYRTARDLEGQTVALPNLKSTGGISISEWLRQSGADVDKVKFYELQFSEMGPALVQGRVAAILTGEPFLTDAKDDIRRLVNPYDYVAPRFYTGVWWGLRDRLARDARAFRLLGDALYAAGRWANAHRAESAAIEARVTKLDVARVRTMERNGFAATLEARYAQPLLDLALRYKLIEKPVQATDLFWNPSAPDRVLPGTT